MGTFFILISGVILDSGVPESSVNCGWEVERKMLTICILAKYD